MCGYVENVSKLEILASKFRCTGIGWGRTSIHYSKEGKGKGPIAIFSWCTLQAIKKAIAVLIYFCMYTIYFSKLLWSWWNQNMLPRFNILWLNSLLVLFYEILRSLLFLYCYIMILNIGMLNHYINQKLYTNNMITLKFSNGYVV